MHSKYDYVWKWCCSFHDSFPLLREWRSWLWPLPRDSRRSTNGGQWWSLPVDLCSSLWSPSLLALLWVVKPVANSILYIQAIDLVTKFHFVYFLQFVPLILSLILLGLQMAVQPYENKWANAAETFALLWLVILLALGNTTPIIIASKELEKFTLWPVFFLPVAIGGCVFIAYIAYRARWGISCTCTVNSL